MSVLRQVALKGRNMSLIHCQPSRLYGLANSCVKCAPCLHSDATPHRICEQFVILLRAVCHTATSRKPATLNSSFDPGMPLLQCCTSWLGGCPGPISFGVLLIIAPRRVLSHFFTPVGPSSPQWRLLSVTVSYSGGSYQLYECMVQAPFLLLSH